jgi:hypothetical protein
LDESRVTPTSTDLCSWSASVERLCESDEAEAQIASPGLSLALQEAAHSQIKGLFAEHIFIRREFTAVERAFPPSVELPQLVRLRLDEAYVVQIDVIVGSRGAGVAAARSSLVGRLEGLGLVEEVGALGWFQRDGLAQQLRQVRVGSCGSG